MINKTFKAKIYRFKWISLLVSSIIILAVLNIKPWQGHNYMPKPYGYNRIILPEHTYEPLADTLPYTFEVSRQATVLTSDSPYAEKAWIDIRYPAFNAAIQITYKQIKANPKLFREYLQAAHQLTAKHQIRAYSIEEEVIQTPKGYTAVVFALTGQVPSQYQFYVTDSATHFLRGALYFHTASQNDSLAPIIEFIRQDIMHILYTLEWRHSSK